MDISRAQLIAKAIDHIRDARAQLDNALTIGHLNGQASGECQRADYRLREALAWAEDGFEHQHHAEERYRKAVAAAEASAPQAEE